MKYVRLYLLLLFFILTYSSGQDGRLSLEEFETRIKQIENQHAFKRLQWFYSQRAYPNKTLEKGYILRALQEKQQPKVKQPSVPSSYFTWTAIGPAPGTYGSYGNISGRMTGISVDPNNSNIIYIAAANGGVWKTTNGGTAWTPQTDFEGAIASGSIVVDPNNSNVLYYGTGEPYYSIDAYGGVGVLKSTNGGSTWFSSGLSNEERITRLAIDPSNSSIVFAATWGGLYRSTNAGSSWTKVLAQASAYDVVVDPNNSQNVYCGIGDNSGNGGVWKSTNGGSTWVKLSGGLPASNQINIVRLAIAPSSSSTVYALMSSDSPLGGLLGAFKTTDGGSSWVDIAAPPTLFGSEGAAGQGWYDICIAVSPTDPNLVFVGGIDTWRSTTGGGSWTNVTNGYAGGNVHVDHHDLYFSGSTLYICTDGGLWKTTNNGNSWINLNNNLAITQFYDLGVDAITPARIYGGTQDNGTQRTTGTSTWTGVLGGDGGVVVVDYTNSNIVYAETQNGNHFKSTNGGTSWFNINNGISGSGPWVTPVIIHPTVPSTLFTSTNLVYKTTNGGLLWSATTFFTASSVTSLAYKGIRSTLYASSGGNIYKSTDEGSSWVNITIGLPGRTITDIEFDDVQSTAVYVTLSGTGSSGHVFKSTNEGSSWTNISGDLPNIPTNTIKVQPGNAAKLYVGTDLGLYISTNGGTNWFQDNGIPHTALIDLEITSDNYLVAGTHGRSAWKASLGSTISGYVMIDRDANSETSSDRIPSAGWKVKLYMNSNLVDSTFTPFSGIFTFAALGNGMYDIYLSPRTNYFHLDALPGTGGTSETKIDSLHLLVEVNNGEVSSGNTFLVYTKSSISGIVFEDLNGNKTRETGEPLINGMVITLNGPENALDTTDINGAYTFSNLIPGIYTVSESLPSGWVTSTPNGGIFTDTLFSGSPLAVNFGNFRVGSIRGVKFRDSDQDGTKDSGEPLLSGWKIIAEGTSTPAETVETDAGGSYLFSNLGPDTYTVKEVLAGSGWGQTKPHGNYIVALRSGLDTSGLDFGNFPLDSIKYRTASMRDWALATDAKGKYKPVKRKPDKVAFKFNLVADSSPVLTLEFSMEVTATITKGVSKAETLATVSGKKKASLTLNVLPGDTIQIDGWGVKGKQVKVKYKWGDGAKNDVTDYQLNEPRLPLPNLHNVGEELYTLQGGFFAEGLKVGIGDGGGSVVHLKYKDVLKSLNKKGTVHTGDASCLTGFKKQLKSLPPDKKNNKLFAELVALKLNIKASELLSMPPGFKDLIYSDSGSVFDGKTVKEIMQQVDTFLTKCDTVNPKGVTANDYYNVLVALDTAFSGPLDTLSFGVRTKLTGVRYLADVPYLKPNSGVDLSRTEPEFVVVEQTAREYVLYQNYPNPFNPVTTIRFTLPEESRVTLKVYNLLGQEVATLLEKEELDEGIQEVEFYAEHLASGIYFYRLIAESLDEDAAAHTFTRVMKMIMVK
jgi:hypothetical protein